MAYEAEDGGRLPPPDLKNVRANSVFRESASCSKFLNDQKYFKTEKNFRATLVFSASASCSKILSDQKYAFSTCIQVTLCLSEHAQVAQKP